MHPYLLIVNVFSAAICYLLMCNLCFGAGLERCFSIVCLDVQYNRLKKVRGTVSLVEGVCA